MSVPSRVDDHVTRLPTVEQGEEVAWYCDDVVPSVGSVAHNFHGRAARRSIRGQVPLVQAGSCRWQPGYRAFLTSRGAENSEVSSVSLSVAVAVTNWPTGTVPLGLKVNGAMPSPSVVTRFWPR